MSLSELEVPDCSRGSLEAVRSTPLMHKRLV